MTIGLLFWIIMVVWFVFGLYTHRTAVGPWLGESLAVFVLLALLGWRVFGPAIHH